VTHHEHNNVTAWGRGAIEAAGHDTMVHGGAVVGSKEEEGMRWCWTARGEASGLSSCARSWRSELREQLDGG
jgi:hypothetical protein